MAEILLSPWQIHHPHPTDAPQAIASDGQKYVMVDAYGQIFTSVSGYNWTLQETPAISPLSDIVYAQDRFVAVGAFGRILTSTNGTNWITAESPTTNHLGRSIFATDQFVAVGARGTIVSSADGNGFSLHTVPSTNQILDMAAGPGTLVAVGGGNTVMVSTNHGEWKSAHVTTTNLMTRVAYFKGRYHNGWFSTADPMHWTNTVGASRSDYINALAATTNVIGRIVSGRFQYTDDPFGRTWPNNNSTPQSCYWINVISNSFALLGPSAIYLERNGSFEPGHAKLDYLGFPVGVFSIAGDTNGYLAMDFFGTPRLFSPNAYSWRLRKDTDPPVDTNENVYATAPFARARGGSIYVSSDRTNWQDIAKPESTILHAAALGSIIVASGSSNVWLTTDGTNWTKTTTRVGPPRVPEGGTSEPYPPNYPWVTSINAGHGLLAMTTSFGELLLSTNGINWETNQTMFSFIHDATFTPAGMLICSYTALAEARFGGGTAAVPPFALNVVSNRFYFDAPLGRYDVQSSTNLVNWNSHRRNATNGVFATPTEVAPTFFRAVRYARGNLSAASILSLCNSLTARHVTPVGTFAL